MELCPQFVCVFGDPGGACMIGSHRLGRIVESELQLITAELQHKVQAGVIENHSYSIES